MNTRRTTARRFEENDVNEMISPQVENVEKVHQGAQVPILGGDKLMAYTQSLEESKLGRIARNLKKSGSSDQGQPRSKKRSQTGDGTSAPKVRFGKACDSQNGKPTCATCGKRHYGECG
ncbi:hypothetical protein EJD97_004549 [Solanum chilense]|uniref:Uncharacterized protein n=1 Tax=Solanum chilense TaxID=4083 RepID=A0A6N2BU97_SOLCI|nr:hypothetical protein EJD97_004549 [Solanum chilense]